MRDLKKVMGFIFIIAIFFSLHAKAQDAKANLNNKNTKALIKGISNLTEPQKAQLRANQEEIKKAEEFFRASLSDEQKGIFDNNNLSSQEKRKALMKNLTIEQKETMKNNLMVRKEMLESFKKTLTEEQNVEMMKLMDKRKQKIR